MKLGNNLLIKSNKGGDLKIDYNQSSDCLFYFLYKVSNLFPHFGDSGKEVRKRISGSLLGGCLTCEELVGVTWNSSDSVKN